MTELIPPMDSPEEEGSNLCTACRLKTAEPGYSSLLCATCRDHLARRPFPLFIKISALLILVVLVFALKRFDHSVRAGIAFTCGQRAERARDYALAAQHYQAVVAIFPDSPLALVRLANAYFYAGQPDKAAAVIARLKGREVSRKLAADIERTMRDINGARRRKQAEGDANVHLR